MRKALLALMKSLSAAKPYGFSDTARMSVTGIHPSQERDMAQRTG